MGTFGERFFPLSFTTLREREEEREEEEERERERGREREEEHMVDFQGQKFVETFALVAISSASFVGFALGYALLGGGGRGGRGGERALVETTHSKVHFIGRKEGRGIYRLVVFYLLLLYYYHDRAVARHIPSRRLSCSSTFLIRSLNPSSPPVGSVYGGAMEISSKTTMTWSFHRHGSVRANASKISCACSVTFSPMLSE